MKKIEDLAQKKKTELETTQKDLKEAATKYNNQNRVSIALRKAKSNKESERDKLLVNQAENDRIQKTLEKRLEIQRRISRHWEDNCDIHISNLEEINMKQQPKTSGRNM